MCCSCCLFMYSLSPTPVLYHVSRALSSAPERAVAWHDSCALLYTARAWWGMCSGGQPGVVVTDVCGGGRKWPNEDDCSARHSAGLIAIYFRAPLLCNCFRMTSNSSYCLPLRCRNFSIAAPSNPILSSPLCPCCSLTCRIL